MPLLQHVHCIDKYPDFAQPLLGCKDSNKGHEGPAKRTSHVDAGHPATHLLLDITPASLQAVSTQQHTHNSRLHSLLQCPMMPRPAAAALTYNLAGPVDEAVITMWLIHPSPQAGHRKGLLAALAHRGNHIQKPVKNGNL